MDLNTKLDFNVVAVDSGETVHLLLELEAPGLEGERRRDPANVQVVLDRSGSMANGSLLSALKAIDSLVGRLGPDDRFGLVCFDDSVVVPVAAGPVGDGKAIRQVLPQIHPGGMTNLGSGLMRGVQEAGRDSDGAPATLVLLSDGHANQGIVEHGALGDIAASAQRNGTTISTIGIGAGYDEDLLETVSRSGGGNAHFAEDGDQAGGHLSGEIDGLLEQVIQAASLVVKPAGTVSGIRLFNDLPVSNIEGGFMVELGELVSSEKRRLLFEIDVPDIAGLGLAEVCEMKLSWVETGTMESKSVEIPVHVNVVPGDQAAYRVPDPQVITELTFQRAQRDKREASDALARGDHATARALWHGSRRRLSSLDPSRMSEQERLDVKEELEMLDRIESRSSSDVSSARKISQSDYHRKSRKRGRNPRDRGE